MQEENLTQQKGNEFSKTLIKEKTEEECDQSNESMVIISPRNLSLECNLAVHLTDNLA